MTNPPAEVAGLTREQLHTLLHAVFHLLDDSETNAQTDAISIDAELSQEPLHELMKLADEIGLMSHEDCDAISDSHAHLSRSNAELRARCEELEKAEVSQDQTFAVAVELERAFVRSLATTWGKTCAQCAAGLGQQFVDRVTSDDTDSPSVIGNPGPAPMPTEADHKAAWRSIYIATMVKAGLEQGSAEDCYEAGVGDFDFTEDPEAAANDEMEYWTDDGDSA